MNDTINNESRSFSNNRNSIDSNIYSSTNSTMNNPFVIQLIELGIPPIYSKRIFLFYHPSNFDDALDYLSFENGIIQHNFVQDRNKEENDICYLCGENKNIHLGSIPLNNNVNESNNRNSIYNSYNEYSLENEIKNSIDNNSSKSKSISKSINYSIASQTSKECPICEDSFNIDNYNKLKKCGHSFCNNCWYDFLSIKIQENKLTSIKCLDYECQERPDDDFIINLLNSNEQLIEKYKKFKLQLEVINDPNKKLCPFPNCNSYLELKDINNKYVKCLNDHTFCFLCLNEPHGKLPCESKLTESLNEYAKNNFIKKCPNCSIITEKISGCNHITCYKCNYQWCWLCNEQYTYDHFIQGKCRGYQFFKPKDENDIKLAFEGKIQLRESEIQEDFSYYDEMEEDENSHNTNISQNENNIHVNIENNVGNSELRNIPNNNNNNRNIEHDTLEEIMNFKKSKKILMLFIYIFFGHIFISGNIYLQNWKHKIILLSIFLIEIPYFFIQIIINILMLFIYIFKESFNSFIYQFYYNVRFNKNKFHRFHKITNSIYYLIIVLFMGTFLFATDLFIKCFNNKGKRKKIIFFILGYFLTFIISPLHIIINPFLFLYFINFTNCHFEDFINNIREFTNFSNVNRHYND